MAKYCATSKKEITNDIGSVRFPCPSCGNEIIRSRNAREIAATYKCDKCGFQGP